MVDVEFILKKHLVEVWSIRRISRQLDLARQTVRRAVLSSEAPRYHLSKPRPCPIMDPYGEVIRRWLAQDAHAPPKQRHTGKRIYDRLVSDLLFFRPLATSTGFSRQFAPIGSMSN